MNYIYSQIRRGLIASLILVFSGMLSAKASMTDNKPMSGSEAGCKMAYTKDANRRSQQGMVVWKSILLAYEDGGHCRLYDRSSGKLKHIGDFKASSSSKDNHCNQVNLGVTQLKNAALPLLYLTVGKPGSEIDMQCHVENLVRKGNKWQSSLVQTIRLDTTGWREAGRLSIFGGPSWLIDRTRKQMWVFSARRRTIKKTMPTTNHNVLIATRFRIPELSEGREVRLGVDDIEEQVAFDMDTYITQSGFVDDGKIYYTFGYDKLRHPEIPARLRIYDLDRRATAGRFNLDDVIEEEVEAVQPDGDRLLINTNSQAIYQMPMPQLKNETKWRGTYCTDPSLLTEDRSVPAGYKPFYMANYGRHGIRFIDVKDALPNLRKIVSIADSLNLYTELGAIMRSRLESLLPYMNYRTGDLTQGGQRQWQEYAAKVCREYPELVGKGKFAAAQSTNIMRAALSMQAFNAELGRLQPEMKISGEASEQFHPWLNPYAAGCPTKRPIDDRHRTRTGIWYNKWHDFVVSNLDIKQILGRLFKDPTPLLKAIDQADLVETLFLLRCGSPILDRPECFEFVLTPEEADKMRIADNYAFFMQKGKFPANLGRPWQHAAKMVRNIVDLSEDDLANGRNGMRMRFGHDGCITAILTLIDGDGWGTMSENPYEVEKFYPLWKIPMATKLNLVFFKKNGSENESDIICKLTLNGEAVALPLPEAGASKCYRWSDIRNDWRRRIAEAESALLQTENM